MAELLGGGEKQLLEGAIDAVGIALAVVDELGRFIWANGTFGRWFGPCGPGEPVSKTNFRADLMSFLQNSAFSIPLDNAHGPAGPERSRREPVEGQNSAVGLIEENEVGRSDWSTVSADGQRRHYRTVFFRVKGSGRWPHGSGPWPVIGDRPFDSAPFGSAQDRQGHEPVEGQAPPTGPPSPALERSEGSEAKGHRPALERSEGTPEGLLLVTTNVTEEVDRKEQLAQLRQIGQMMQEERDLDRLLHRVLTCATAGHALGFNRAFLFRVDEERSSLDGALGVGPASREEAWRVWDELARKQVSLEGLLATADFDREQLPLYHLIKDLSYSLASEQEILVRTVRQSVEQVVHEAEDDPRVTPAFFKRFGAKEFVSVPLVARGRVTGVLLADNIYSRQPITDETVENLAVFAGYAAIAIENAATYAALAARMEEWKKAQDEMLHSERLAVVGRMAARVAHEIKNPLVTIGGFARSILKNPEKTDRCRDSARIIQEEAARLEEILREITDFSRPPKAVRVPEDLNKTLRHTCALMEDTLAERGVRLVAELDPDLPPVPIDKQQLQQVMLNLIRNGAEAIDQESGTVTVRSAREAEHAVIRVSDTGPGMLPEVIGRVFEPFFTTKADGIGLGLAVTKMIVQDHGGRIEAANGPDSGTTFAIRLPLRVGS